MNRGTVVFLALALLLAHTLAIHQTPDGAFAEPYEIAHVSFRLGRNLVHDGSALWNPGGAPAESYPSPLWVLVGAVSARLYLGPTVIAQALGFASALATAVVLAWFSPKRSAGLIAPLLLAASGSAAAAAASGTEMALAMLLVTLAFLAFERGARRTLALVLTLLVLTRPEGLAFALVLLGLRLLAPPEGAAPPPKARQSAFVLPLLVVTGTLLVRKLATGLWLSPFAAPLLELDPGRWQLGLLYLWSFVYASGFGLLAAVLVLSLALGRTSPMGRRALALVAAWWGVVVVSGGDDQPFWNALVPVLPLFFLAVQESLREWMDREARLVHAVWMLLGLTMVGAFLASKVPGDVGPLRLEQPLTAWQTPGGALGRAYPRSFGRLGLLEEIRTVEHLRTLGVFLRDRVSEDTSIQTLWPGAIGYLSRKEVLDLAGRAWPLPGAKRTNSWRGVPRVDVLAALAREADYLVPFLGTLPEADAPTDFLRDWLARYDVVGATDERVRELLMALRGYELVAVPVPIKSRNPRVPSERPFPILRRKELKLAPDLELVRQGDELRVLARHEGHQQVVDLCVCFTDARGASSYLRPTGDWEDGPAVDARTSLLLFPSGQRALHLVRFRAPAAASGTLTAWLHNPGMRPDAPLSGVGAPVSLELR